MVRMRRSVVFLLLSIFFAAAASGQSLDRLAETKSNVAYFYHARPGEATVQVALWGTVARPGIYEVPLGTDLDKLLTMAGGAPIQARREGTDATITVRLFRQASSLRTAVYEATLDEMLARPGRYPALQDDDVVVVETTLEEGFQWRDALAIIGSVASVVLVVDRLIR